MALDVYITAPSLQPWEGTLVSQFEWDGEFVYLQRFFPARSSDGAPIDLYGDAVFRGPALSELRAALERAKLGLAERPDRWDEHIGSQLNPDVRGKGKLERLYSTVEKKHLAERIDLLLRSVAKAEADSLELYFFGD